MYLVIETEDDCPHCNPAVLRAVGLGTHVHLLRDDGSVGIVILKGYDMLRKLGVSAADIQL